MHVCMQAAGTDGRTDGFLRICVFNPLFREFRTITLFVSVLMSRRPFFFFWFGFHVGRGRLAALCEEKNERHLMMKLLFLFPCCFSSQYVSFFHFFPHDIRQKLSNRRLYDWLEELYRII